MKPIRLTIAQAATRFLPPLFAPTVGSYIYPRHLGLSDNYAFVGRSITGSWLKGETGDFLAHRFAMYGFYNYRLWAVAHALCKPGDTLIEVGANIGTETIGFADLVGSSGHVYAFEPWPPNFAKLTTTLALNGIQQVSAMPLALSQKAEKLRFAAPIVENSGVGYLLRNETTADSEQPVIEVDCVTLDSLADRIGPSPFICMDAEGSEMYILQGARKYIEQYKPGIVVEAKKTVKASLYDVLREMNYNVYRIAHLGLEPVDLNRRKDEDWFCVPEDKLAIVRKVITAIRYCALMPRILGLNPMSRFKNVAHADALG